ncbi:MAG TPA: hypothetical protein VMA53_17685 [Stellaceae bacterium]|nr:hypothetical protein [Stellaceae bacterium]
MVRLRPSHWWCPTPYGLAPRHKIAAITLLVVGLFASTLHAQPEALRSDQAGLAIDCVSQTQDINRTICSDPELNSANERVAALSRAGIVAAKGGLAARLRQNQEAWIALLPRVCAATTTGAPVGGCRAALGRAFSDRIAELSGPAHRDERIGISGLTPPSDWWGWPAPGEKPPSTIIGVFAGEDGHAYVLAADYHAAAALVDAVDGRLVATDRTEPDMWTGKWPRSRFVLARLGLTELHRALFDGPLKIRQNGRGDCGRPNSYLLTTGAASIYLFRFLPQPVTEPVDGFCEETWSLSPSARTIDYGSLYGVSYQPLTDGTFLAIVGQRSGEYLIRFRKDLSSPFFARRGDVIRADAHEVDALVDAYVQPAKPGYAEAIAAVRKELLELRQRQLRDTH